MKRYINKLPKDVSPYEELKEKFDGVLDILTPDSLIVGGAVRDLLADVSPDILTIRLATLDEYYGVINALNKSSKWTKNNEEAPYYGISEIIAPKRDEKKLSKIAAQAIMQFKTNNKHPNITDGEPYTKQKYAYTVDTPEVVLNINTSSTSTTKSKLGKALYKFENNNKTMYKIKIYGYNDVTLDFNADEFIKYCRDGVLDNVREAYYGWEIISPKITQKPSKPSSNIAVGEAVHNNISNSLDDIEHTHHFWIYIDTKISPMCTYVILYNQQTSIYAHVTPQLFTELCRIGAVLNKPIKTSTVELATETAEPMAVHNNKPILQNLSEFFAAINHINTTTQRNDWVAIETEVYTEAITLKNRYINFVVVVNNELFQKLCEDKRVYNSTKDDYGVWSYITNPSPQPKQPTNKPIKTYGSYKPILQNIAVKNPPQKRIQDDLCTQGVYTSTNKNTRWSLAMDELSQPNQPIIEKDLLEFELVEPEIEHTNLEKTINAALPDGITLPIISHFEELKDTMLTCVTSINQDNDEVHIVEGTQTGRLYAIDRSLFMLLEEDERIIKNKTNKVLNKPINPYCIPKDAMKDIIVSHSNQNGTNSMKTTSFVNIIGKTIKIMYLDKISSQLKKKQNITDLINDIRKDTLLVCDGVFMDVSGAVFEIIEGAYKDCKNKILRVNRGVDTKNSKFKSHIKKLLSVGWRYKHMSTIDVFVYGTLKIGGRFAKQLDSCRVNAKNGSIDGTLIKTPYGYPTVKLNTGNKVLGEIHTFKEPEKALAILDRIEGYNKAKPDDSLFVRKTTIAHAENDESVEVYTYEFAKEEAFTDPAFVEIPGGVWDI